MSHFDSEPVFKILERQPDFAFRKNFFTRVSLWLDDHGVWQKTDRPLLKSVLYIPYSDIHSYRNISTFFWRGGTAVSLVYAFLLLMISIAHPNPIVICIAVGVLIFAMAVPFLTLARYEILKFSNRFIGIRVDGSAKEAAQNFKMRLLLSRKEYFRTTYLAYPGRLTDFLLNFLASEQIISAAEKELVQKRNSLHAK